MLSRDDKDWMINYYGPSLRPFSWDWLFTLTVSGCRSAKVANRRFDRWITEMEQEVGGPKFRWLRVLKVAADQDEVHFHVLIGGIRKQHVHRPGRWKTKWQDIAGFAVVESCDPKMGGFYYLLKSVGRKLDFDDIDLRLPDDDNK